MKKLKVVVVVEGGNVTNIIANQEGVDVVKVDYDVFSGDGPDVKRVAQYDHQGKKTFAPASVMRWGEAQPAPEETRRFFRNAVD